MGPKYELTNETMTWDGHILRRIKRLSDGKIGGWVESENNLSQEYNCWIDDEAKVYDGAYIFGNAQVGQYAQVYGKARVHGSAQIYGYAQVYDGAIVSGLTQVYDNAKVYGVTRVYGYAQVYDNAQIGDHTYVYDNTKVFGNAILCGTGTTYGVVVYENAQISGNAQIIGEAWISGNAQICGDILITNGKYNSGKFFYDQDFIKNFICKVNDLNSIGIRTEYDLIDEFFSAPVTHDAKLDTLIIYAVNTKEPLIKLQKVEIEHRRGIRTAFKFSIDMTNATEDGSDFTLNSIIKSQGQLDQFIEDIVATLDYSKFTAYINDLEKCL